MAKTKDSAKKEPTRPFQDHNGTPIPSSKPTFTPLSGPSIKNLIDLPSDLWSSILQCPCTFPPSSFATVMLNLINNPNLTSSSLFRADIFYDSDSDHLFNSSPSSSWDGTNGGSKWLKEEYRPMWPKAEDWKGWELRRVMVRGLVPRNPVRDEGMVQTCCFLSKRDEETEHSLVLYFPHVKTEEDMPFYHPKAEVLGFLHTWRNSPSPSPSIQQDDAEQPGHLTLLTLLFPNSPSSTTEKLHRTALILLRTIHKHAQGLSSGYQKRVHHDRIIPQARYQNTYTRLKTKYGRTLSEQWVEVTDPGKHVFEDIGIASWLVEVWRDLYQLPRGMVDEAGQEDEEKPAFPGFVDIGCGNGLLVYILLSEGYPGWGFDARERKTWSIFPPEIRSKLQQRVLVPKVLHGKQDTIPEFWDDGYFEPGTFVISNHADELTAWTPLLGYLNGSSWMAIPCCSHDLSGKRFRAPARSRGMAKKKGGDMKAMSNADVDGEDEIDGEEILRLPQQKVEVRQNGENDSLRSAQAAETGSLARPPPPRDQTQSKKMPSAYSTLCSYVSSLASEVGYTPEDDVLRIPSTRNSCVLGRHKAVAPSGDRLEREKAVREVVEREMKMRAEDVGRDWIGRVEGLSVKGSGGH